MSNLQVTREKLPTGTAEPQISGFFSKLLDDRPGNDTKEPRRMSNLQVTREKLPTGTAEPQISGFFSKLLAETVGLLRRTPGYAYFYP
jgi:hypothetical protein